MEPEIEQVDDVTEEAGEAEETVVEDPKPEPKAAKPKETPEAKKARLLRELKRVSRELGDEEAPAPSKPKTGELDETQLDYLDLKGVTEQEDIDVVQKIVQRTGMTIRQALKDDYVVAKLDANRAQRAVKDATPSATKRSGAGATDDVALAIAKYDANGDLPSDFTLRSAVVNAITDRGNTNKPGWHLGT